MALIDDESRFIITADAGGTHTRVACFGLDGSLLGAAIGRGGSPNHNADAADNVARATEAAVRDAGVDPGDAVILVAGLANISRRGSNQGDGDNGWAEDFFAIPSLGCDRVILNDAVVAHRGALQGRPGIAVVAGTGSMILAITEDGTEVESGQFEHYAGAARHLVFETMQLILVGAAVDADADLVASVMAYWGASDLPGLRRVILDLAGSDDREVRRRYGLLAPTVTAAADSSPLADRALRDLAAKTARGVSLLTPLFAGERVPVAASGALAAIPAFTSRLSEALHANSGTRADLVPAALDPLRGAAIIAYQRVGIDIEAGLIERLRQSQVSAVA